MDLEASVRARRAAAQSLSALGYPMGWCLRALAATNDDLLEAAEYMITHGDQLEREAREEEAVRASQAAQETRAEEDGWFRAVAGELGFPTALPLQAAPPSSSPSAARGGGEWGWAMTVTPVYSRAKAVALCEADADTKRKLGVVLDVVARVGTRYDEIIVDTVNALCARKSMDPLVLSPTELAGDLATLISEPPDSQSGNSSTNLTAVLLRFVVLRNFNRRLLSALPFVDLSRDDAPGLARSLTSRRRMVFTQVKRSQLDKALQASHTGDGNSMQRLKVPTVILDRSSKNVFSQLFHQLHRKVTAAQLRNSERAFYCIFAGEHADDYGGPYRDALDQACYELMSEASGSSLMIRVKRGWVPHPRAKSQLALDMFEFVGKLCGIAIRTRTPIPLDLPSLVWKRLVMMPGDLSDITALDPDFAERLRVLRRIPTPEEWASACQDLRFSVVGADGRVVDLIPHGRDVRVPWKAKARYVDLSVQARTEECAVQCAAMLRGLATQVPRNLLKLFTWQELESMVCGPAVVDIDLLRKHTVYGDGLDDESPAVQQFWQVLKEFDDEHRRKYLRFVWGRSRLPLSVDDWDRKHKINLFTVRHHELTEEDEEDEYPGEADQWLPVGHTCFFSVDLPRYSSLQVCRDKLTYAITHCLTIDADETTNARLAADQSIAEVMSGAEVEGDLGF